METKKVSPTRWTEEEVQFLRDNSDMPVSEISNILDRPIYGIISKYKDCGILRSQRRRFTTEESQYIIDNFEQLNNQQIATYLKSNKDAIAEWLHSHGFKRTYISHVPYFDRPCDEEYAYVLGWLFSDGHLSKSLMLGLLEKELPSRFLEYITSFGDSCKRCFLRGFFDGDGYVRVARAQCSITKRIDYDWTNILKLIPPYIKTKVNIKNKENSKGSSLTIYGDACLFFQYIYGAEFKGCLQRKKDRVLAHFEKPYYSNKYGPLMQDSRELSL